MKNLCNNCKLAKWDMDSVENAYCEQNPTFKVIGEGNYVIKCSNYKSTNVIIYIMNLIKKYE